MRKTFDDWVQTLNEMMRDVGDHGPMARQPMHQPAPQQAAGQPSAGVSDADIDAAAANIKTTPLGAKGVETDLWYAAKGKPQARQFMGYYPGWTVADFRALYLKLYGEEPE